MKSSILMYHSLDESGSVVSVSPAQFEDQAAQLASGPRPVVTLDRVRQTPGAIAITFDDGMCSFADVALPILERYRLPATVFIVSDRVGLANHWQPDSWSIPSLPLMSLHQIRALPPHLVTIGAHSATHPDLTRLSMDRVRSEVAAGRASIEDMIGRPIDSFAYPFGRFNRSVREIVSQHFVRACGTRLAQVGDGGDPFDLPRIDAYYLRAKGRFEAFLQDGSSTYLAGRRMLHGIRALAITAGFR